MQLLTSNFSLLVRSKSHATILILQFFNNAISTKQFPRTLELLKMHAPKVLHTKCFNPSHLTFKKEVVNTELGHLFEHILLSFLCEEKIRAGADRAFFDGVTLWNWSRYPKGNFKIVVSGRIEKTILHAALLQTIHVIELLLSASTESIEILNSHRQQPHLRPLSKSSLLVS